MTYDKQVKSQGIIRNLILFLIDENRRIVMETDDQNMMTITFQSNDEELVVINPDFTDTRLVDVLFAASNEAVTKAWS